MISKTITLKKGGKVEFIAKRTLDLPCEIRFIKENGEKIIHSEFSMENFMPSAYAIEGTFHIEISHPEALIINHLIAFDDLCMQEGVTLLHCEKGSLKVIPHENLEDFYLENRYRPHIHFTSPRGWINDPNGLCYFQGNYHLFYQYYPHDCVWGNMHWGHAISKDLLHWTHLPITLYPEIEDCYFGGAFSGSAVEVEGKMVLFYTHHFEDTRGKVKFQNSEFIENQCVVESRDGIHFTKWAEPVVESAKRGSKVSNDFRDPKVWLDSDGKYKMILGSAYEGKPAIIIYESSDLKAWRSCGPLYIEESIVGRCIECPDLFKLDGHYVMLASIIEKIDGKEKHVTRYHIGEYRNNRFYSSCSEIIDFGPSFYAIQTFDSPHGRTAIAWLDSWQDMKKSYAKDFAGAMSIPLIFSLKDERLQMTPISLESLKCASESVNLSNLKHAISSPAFSLQFNLTKKDLNGSKFHFSTTTRESVSVMLETSKENVILTVIIQENALESRYSKTLSVKGECLEFHAIFDRTSLEVMTNDYCDRGSFRFYFEQPISTLQTEGVSAQAVGKLEYYHTIWRKNGNN